MAHGLDSNHPDVVLAPDTDYLVHNYFHIGNARPLVVFDTLRRYLEWRGYEVNFVQNFTDIDDKIIRRANEEGITYEQVAEKYIAEFWTDAKGLGVREATTHPKATENIDTIIDIVSRLVERGYAYRAENGDVYFQMREANNPFYDALPEIVQREDAFMPLGVLFCNAGIGIYQEIRAKRALEKLRRALS